jgi:hypothetical protein
MFGTQPQIIFLHYWGTGPAKQLANGFKAALNELGTGGKMYGGHSIQGQPHPATHE